MDPLVLYNHNNGSNMDVNAATSILPDADQEYVRFREESRFWIQRVRLFRIDYMRCVILNDWSDNQLAYWFESTHSLLE